MRKSVVPPTVSPAPALPTLAEQKSDFTAEGSPPPGKVSTSTPVGAHVEREAAAPMVPVGPAAKRKGTPASQTP